MTDQYTHLTEAERAWLKLAEAAAPGPWHVRENRDNHWGAREVIGPAIHVLGFTIATDISAERAANIEAEAKLIAASRTAVPALLAEVSRLRGALAPLVELGDAMDKEFSRDALCVAIVGRKAEAYKKCLAALGNLLEEARAALSPAPPAPKE